MRANLFVPAVAAGLLVLSGCDFEDFGGLERYHEDFHYNHPLNAGGRVSVEGFNGSIEISTWEQNTVDISGTKYARSQDEVAAIRVDVEHSTEAVSVRAVRPYSRHGNFGVRFVVKVPRNAVYDHLVTSNGTIRASDGAGPARMKTSNGRIDVQRFHGGLRADTSNGPIEIVDQDGAVEAHTSNGHVRIDRLRGALEATTSNGSIHAQIERAMDSVRLHSSNGTLDLTLPGGAQCPVRADTSNSSITVRMPGEVNARLSASTSNGSISSDFEIGMRGEINKHHIEGTLGTGGALIDLSTSNGSIRILR